ncbi:unnamed protein product [Leptosia nina]|uniref:Uncharacterized protein n=1 Tax=Leptosia nina TaxID=320188 RepID=A0AAV1J0H4_9NEOP
MVCGKDICTDFYPAGRGRACWNIEYLTVDTRCSLRYSKFEFRMNLTAVRNCIRIWYIRRTTSSPHDSADPPLIMIRAAQTLFNFYLNPMF